jgi:sterol desaturase/sphingolipid hydroxylase (fatty acid hydroxylase superfamily)
MHVSNFIISHEVLMRLGGFFGILGIVSLWEMIAPRRALTISKPLRWINNIGIVFLNSFLLRIIFPSAAVGVATFAQKHGWGFFYYLQVSYIFAVLSSIIAMDFFIYLQHVMFHAVPVFWRVHRMHHTDLDFDVTTGIRFHPIEIILSMLIKFAVIVVIGPPVVSVIVFEVVLNATSMFNHGNLHIPRNIDKVMRWFMVTPDMHRVHHSVDTNETNTNFGFNMPWWDRLLGTYKNQPHLGHEGMIIGLREFRDVRQSTILSRMLAIPFVDKT